MRRLALLLALFLAPAYLSAQTIVSGQVKDTSGLDYSGATLNITFNPSVGQPVTLPSLGLNYLGQFTTLIIPPAAGTYTFAANFGGISPPIGTGPQTCTTPGVTISGGTQTVTFTGCPLLTNISGGGGGGVPAAPPAGIQVNNGASAFGTQTGLNSILFGTDSFGSPTILNVPFSQSNAGPNPYIDTLDYFMRGVTTPPSFTFNCLASSAVITMTGGAYASLQNNDGVAFPGCGAATSISTPTITSVTPCLLSSVDTMNDCVVAPAGSTTATYQVVLRDKFQGFTAASSSAATSTGWPLGVLSATITSQARSGRTVSVVLASALPCAVGAVGFDTNSTDASFSGFPIIASCNGGSTPANTTTLTYTQGYDTAQPIPVLAGPTYSNNSATGGTFQVYSVNHIVMPTISGTGYQYWAYTAGGAFRGYFRPTEASYMDFGAVAPAIPFWIPTTAPVAGQNDMLATTITAGGATASVTVATPATASVTGGTGSFDDAPNFQNACTAAIAGSGATLRLSTSGAAKFYYFMSHTICGSNVLHVQQANAIFLNETQDFAGTWSGLQGGQNGATGAFGYGSQPIINVVGAYPGFHFFGSTILDHVTIQPGIQGLGMTIGSGGNFNVTLEYVNCAFPGTDVTGECAVTYGVSNMQWKNVNFTTNDSSSRGYSFTPLVLNRDDVAGSNGSGDFTCLGCFFQGRGFGWETQPLLSSNVHVNFIGNSYGQAVIGGPMFMMGPGNSPILTFLGGRNDSSSIAMVGNWGTSLNVFMQNIPDNSTEAGGAPGTVTGNLISNLQLINAGGQPFSKTAVAFIGQNVNVNQSGPGCWAFNKLANNCTNAQVDVNGGVSAANYLTATNCASAASPAVCGSAAAGAVNIAAAASSVVVDSTAVTANSRIQVTFDSSLGTALSVTCNTTAQQPYVTARTAATSFTISVPSTFTANPGCFSYQIVN